MKILVCGSGVIGSLLIHTLLQNNNEVTVLARGKRREELEKYGCARNSTEKRSSTPTDPGSWERFRRSTSTWHSR